MSAAPSRTYPYGEVWYETGTASKWKFTTYERDAESGNDYAMARTYVNRLGRFNAPDPLAGSILDPQSLNRYAYVVNDPVNLIDPLGLDHHMQVICTLDGIQTDCDFALGLLLSGAAGLGPSGPGWVPAGGDYRGSGCFANRVTDQVWCPPPVSTWFRLIPGLRPLDPGGDGPGGEERVLSAGLGSVLRYVARNLRIDGPSPGFAYANGRAFGIR